jgi:cytoskeleton protein RodZ
MSETVNSTPAPAARPTTAGGLLRQARQARGLHIAALAASIKVVPRKLELLESDQFDQLPDATFTRALAQTVCRTLKIDAAPVLALLPPLRGHRLEHVASGLNTPFRERPGQFVPKEWASTTSPVLWVAGLIVALAMAVYTVPASWLQAATAVLTPRPRALETVPVMPGGTTESTPTTDAAALPAVPVAAAASGAVGGDAAVPTPAGVSEVAPAVPDAVTAAAASGVLQFRATDKSWVEVTDARGQSLISRLLLPGETVGLDGALPIKVRVGNASNMQVTFRGQPLDLASYTRNNIARLELK